MRRGAGGFAGGLQQRAGGWSDGGHEQTIWLEHTLQDLGGLRCFCRDGNGSDLSSGPGIVEDVCAMAS
ncbi:hypothetical protein [Paenibacillus sp. y28]|uniref:hypothetical protein n=1 Tax=Paenibacillus sp. y28 TaxID=3129110 RepID=UPI00301A1DFA